MSALWFLRDPLRAQRQIDSLLMLTFSGHSTDHLPDEVAARIRLREEQSSALLLGLRRSERQLQGAERARRARSLSGASSTHA